jgi:hypothetical protein
LDLAKRTLSLRASKRERSKQSGSFASSQVVDIIPPRPELLVSEGESIKLDQPLTSNPNVGGFGQGDAEIVLQDPLRVQGLLFFLASPDQLADVFTKSLCRNRLEFICSKLGLYDIYAPA